MEKIGKEIYSVGLEIMGVRLRFLGEDRTLNFLGLLFCSIFCIFSS